MHDTTERLRCRSCGIGSCDVGFTTPTEPGGASDLLCDSCETALRQHLADFAVRSMLRAVTKARAAGWVK